MTRDNVNRWLASVAPIIWWLIPLATIAAVLGWETDWGRSLRVTPPVEAPVTPKPVAAAVLPDFAIEGGLAARPETVARTLFNPTRRPAPVAVAEAPRPTMKRGQFTLTGTLVTEGKSTAFLRETSGGKSRRVLQGESINGLLVAEVKPDRVKLAFGDEFEDLILKVASNPRPAAVAGAPVAPPPGAGTGSAARPGGRPAVAPAAAPVANAGGPTADANLLERRRVMREEIAAQQAAAAAAAMSGSAAAPPVDGFGATGARANDGTDRQGSRTRRTK